MKSKKRYTKNDKVLVKSLAGPNVWVRLTKRYIVNETEHKLGVDGWEAQITQQKEEEDNNFNNLYEGIKQKEYGNEKWEQCLYRICFADTNLRSNFIQIQSFLSILVDKKIDYENSDDLDNVLKTSSATAVTVKKTTSKRQENFEGTCNYIKDWWLQNKKIDEKILNEKIEILRGIHEIWKEVTENNSDLKISYHNATVG